MSEELLMPRYKIIADYPQSNINPFHVGDILTKNGIHFTRLPNPKSLHQDIIGNYPHLFKKLEWWEDRKFEDMPEYVNVQGMVKHIVKWHMNKFMGYIHFPARSPNDVEYLTPDLLPATKEEYEAQQNK